MDAFTVVVGPSSWLFTPESPRAKRWLRKNLFPVNGLSVAKQRGLNIVRALRADGFVVLGIDLAGRAETQAVGEQFRSV